MVQKHQTVVETPSSRSLIILPKAQLSNVMLPCSSEFWKTTFFRVIPFPQDSIRILESYGLYDEGNWKHNFRHAVHRLLKADVRGYKNAEKEILDSLRDESLCLKFVDSVLSIVPTVVASLVNLSTLYLCELDVRELPTDVRGLKNLTSLTVTKCPLYTLPDWVGELSALEYVNVSRCKLTSIPKTLANCAGLNTLLLSYNYISELPEEVAGMDSTERLELDANPLNLSSKLSSGSLKSCLILCIDQTFTRWMPSQITERLVTLSWTDCGVTDFPSLGNTIQYVNLCKNKIARLPASVQNRPKLEYLNMFDNPIREGEEFAYRVKKFVK